MMTHDKTGVAAPSVASTTPSAEGGTVAEAVLALTVAEDAPPRYEVVLELVLPPVLVCDAEARVV
jgi:hypothetical protein